MSTSGLTIHKHYCESALVAVSLLPSVEDACDSDMLMDEDTCKDDHLQYSVDSPLAYFPLNLDLTPSYEWLTSTQFLVEVVISPSLETSKFIADISPPPSEPDIYLKVQSFLL